VTLYVTLCIDTYNRLKFGDQFGGFSVVACGAVPVDLEVDAEVGVADPVANDLRYDAAVQTGRERGKDVADVV
jgi:hypothetical protein